MKVGRSYIIIWLLIFMHFLLGTDWPNNLQSSLGADYEKIRILVYQEPNMVGTDIVELQERLKELGFYTRKINGIYDRQVQGAVVEFQRDNGLASNGIVRQHVG